MLDFTIDGNPCQMPTEWSELTERQVYLLLPFLYADKNSPRVRMAVFRLLYPVKRKSLLVISAEDLFRLQERCLWVWEKPVRTLIYKFEFAGENYYLPELEFDNLVLVEYAMADMFFKAFGRTKPDPLALDKLAATLCRPKFKNVEENDPEWNGDIREKYNSKLADQRTALFKDLPLSIKMLVLQQFITGRKILHTRYKEVFQDPDKPKSIPKHAGPDWGWFGLIDDLAQDGIFGDMEKTAFTNLHTVLFHQRKKYFRLREERRTGI